MTFNKMQMVKRRMFAMRNGVIADTLRRAGSPYRIIFGLNLPQIVEMAGEFGPDPELGRMLHENATTRCSRLLAPMLMDKTDFSEEEARRWMDDVLSVEEADVLCHRLLRHLPYASRLVESIESRGSALTRYCCLRLARNMQRQMPELAVRAAQSALHSDHAPTARLASEILELAEME